MFHDSRRRPVHQVFENVQRIVQVSEIGLTGMLARLDHLLLSDAADQPFPRLDESHARKFKVSFHQLIHGGLLVRVLSVPEPLFDQFTGRFICQFPRPFSVGQRPAAERDGHFRREAVRHEGFVHFLNIGH